MTHEERAERIVRRMKNFSADTRAWWVEFADAISRGMAEASNSELERRRAVEAKLAKAEALLASIERQAREEETEGLRQILGAEGGMNKGQLDRLLWEHLGGVGDIEHAGDCDLETYDYGNPWRAGKPKCTCTPDIKYPALSSTWDGMGRLIGALHEHKWGYQISSDAGPATALVYGHERTSRSDGDSPMIALALAAAKALGIEAPE